MNGIEHIVSSASAPWCSWTMLGLLLCAVLSEWFQPGVISQSPISLAVRNDRTYKESPVNFMGQFLVSLFRIGTVGMALCLCLSPENDFSFLMFIAVCGLVLAVLLLKMLCNSLLDYTFMLTRQFGAPYEHYGNLFTLVALVLYPIVLVLMHWVTPVAARWCLAVVTGLFVIAWLYRCIRTYITSAIAVLYLMLYMMTLEILPFAGLAYISAKMIVIL
ncbi:MAG: DUF4271 domain-containing protein [Paludibacteraceae bacterium]|nr:DUF4271 domain-containing protein [Paludibacteraceae bacterium]